MKRTALVALVAVAALSLAACSPKAPEYATRAEKIVAEIHNPSSKYVVVASHRGDWRNFPENSIPAIESVIKMGVDIMELDELYIEMLADLAHRFIDLFLQLGVQD